MNASADLREMTADRTNATADLASTSGSGVNAMAAQRRRSRVVRMCLPITTTRPPVAPMRGRIARVRRLVTTHADRPRASTRRPLPLPPDLQCETAFAQRLLQGTPLDTVLEPPVDRVIELTLRLIGGSTLRDDVELGTEGDPAVTGFSTHERPQLKVQLNRVSHLRFGVLMPSSSSPGRTPSALRSSVPMRWRIAK